MELNVPVFPLNEPVELNGENLEDFYYLACGEEERLAIVKGKDYLSQSIDANQKNKGDGKVANKNSVGSISHKLGKHLVQLSKKCRVDCTIAFGGFNPPPANRRMLGDLAYVQVNLPAGEGVVHITAIPTGFYVNRSSSPSGGAITFDPSPAAQPCFSHEILDCLLLKSSSLRIAWVSVCIFIFRNSLR
jgi:protein TIF31